MTDHLPECLLPDFDKGGWVCICHLLRVCERRVQARYSAYLNADDEGSYAAGFRDALDAAEAAVAEWISYTFPAFRPSWTEKITDAIRVLKERL